MKVLVVDDEAPARARLARLVSELEGFEVVGEAGDGAETIRRAQDTEGDIILLDVRMPGMDGLEAARHLVRRRP